MTVDELIERVRSYLGDTEGVAESQSIWTDDDLTAFLQDAEQEAAERADLLETDGVDAYCKITLVAGASTYALNSLVYDVKKARVAGHSQYLNRTSRDKLDKERHLWEDESGPADCYYITGNSIRVVPAPSANGVLNLVVLRLPITPIGTSPEINARHHFRMLDWVYRQAYLQDDTDAYDPQKSEMFERRFEKSFGPRRDARLQTRQLKRTAIEMADAYDR